MAGRLSSFARSAASQQFLSAKLAALQERVESLHGEGFPLGSHGLHMGRAVRAVEEADVQAVEGACGWVGWELCQTVAGV